jgi:hypothetical protein
MAVPLPGPDDVNLDPPDEAEVHTVTRGFLGAVASPSGLTHLQEVLITAVAHSMTGFLVDPRSIEPLAPDDFAPALRRRNLEFRARIVQVMLLGELILVPIPPDVTERVARVAELLGVHDSMIDIAKECATGNLGLALIDFERNGYRGTGESGHDPLHTRRALDAAWELDVDDPALSARWASLEACGEGSLGRGVFDFYRARGFVFPGMPGSAPPYLCQHDWVHVLADYGTTVEAEIEVFGLIAEAIPDPRGFSLLAMVIGLFETGYLPRGAGLFVADRGHLSRRGMAERLADAMRRGAACGHDLMAVDWFELADRSVADVRSELGIVPKSDDVRAAGSVGPWEHGGISPYQVSAGMAAAEAEGRPYDSAGASVE